MGLVGCTHRCNYIYLYGCTIKKNTKNIDCLYVAGDTTRIILMFLAVADIGCLLTNLFISVVPITKPFWFQVKL